MSELNWYWVYTPYLDAPEKQAESATKAGYAKVCFKSEADEEIAKLEALNHDLCERVTENDEIRLHWEEIEQTRAENERLKARIAELEK